MIKKLTFIFVALMGLAFASCDKDSVDNADYQCCATTNAGSRCSRSATQGPFDYVQGGQKIGKYYLCWQHNTGSTIGWYYY